MDNAGSGGCPLEVYCYLRKPKEGEDDAYVKAIGEDTISMIPPPCSLAYKSAIPKETRHVFRHLFTEGTSQRQMFAQLCIPSLTDVLNGRDALLFTYGVSGSGKTYSLSGTSQDPGMLPRSIDTIFNSIELMERYCLHRNPQSNEFTKYTDADRMLERQRRDLIPGLLMSGSKDRGCVAASIDRIRDDSKILCVENGSKFAVFVSYLEIYNKYVYDLLENMDSTSSGQVKVLREDRTGRTFARDLVEVEARSAVDAYNLYLRGSQRKHIGKTSINNVSSRGHCIFTMRLVRISNKEEESDLANVSQFSMVDLAGIERAARSNTAGDRLREAGCINSSLLTLRNCLDALRHNQKKGTTERVVPYRDSKLTTLFKHFMEGQGRIVMLLCVNPSIKDFDDNVHVMKFAEATQEIQRPESLNNAKNMVSLRAPAKRPLCEIDNNTSVNFESSIRRKINKFEKITGGRHEASDGHKQVVSRLPDKIELESCFDKTTIPALVLALQSRVAERQHLYQTCVRDLNVLAEQVAKLTNHMSQCAQRNEYNKSTVDHERRLLEAKQRQLEEAQLDNEKQIGELHACLGCSEGTVANLQKLIADYSDTNERLKDELRDAKEKLQKTLAEKVQCQAEMEQRVSEMKKAAKERLDDELRRQQMLFDDELIRKVEKIKRVRDIVSSEDDVIDGLSSSRWTPTRGLTSHTQQSPHSMFYHSEFVITPVRYRTAPSTASRGVDAASSSSTITTVTPPAMVVNMNTTNGFINNNNNNNNNSEVVSSNGSSGCAGCDAGGDTATTTTEVSNKNLMMSPRRFVPVNRFARRASRCYRGKSYDVWLDHRPNSTLATDSILQPRFLERRRSVSCLNLKNTLQSSKYVLTDQEQTGDGQLITRLVKGDILSSKTGGANVIFTDVESAHTYSPDTIRFIHNPLTPTSRSRRNSRNTNHCPSSATETASPPVSTRRALASLDRTRDNNKL